MKHTKTKMLTHSSPGFSQQPINLLPSLPPSFPLAATTTAARTCPRNQRGWGPCYYCVTANHAPPTVQNETVSATPR